MRKFLGFSAWTVVVVLATLFVLGSGMRITFDGNGAVEAQDGAEATPEATEEPVVDCDDPQDGGLVRGSTSRIVDWARANGAWAIEFSLDRADRTLGNALSFVQDQYHSETGLWPLDKVISVHVPNSQAARFMFLGALTNAEGFGLFGMPLQSGTQAEIDAQWAYLDTFTMTGTGGEVGMTVAIWDADDVSLFGNWVRERLNAGCDW